jgi:signal transduction histidine kinase
MYHTPTAFFIIGLLYIFLPMVVWLALRHQASKTIWLWCFGGGIFAVGMLLIAARAFVPLWLTYTVANTLAWTGLLMQATALRHALQKGWEVKWSVFIIVVWVVVFEYIRLVLENAPLRFGWAVAMYIGAFFCIANYAREISLQYELENARWLSLVYVLAGLILAVRMIRVTLGLADSDVIAEGIDSILTVIIGLLISVVGSFSFLSIFLEFAAKREIKNTEKRVRQEEIARLGEQIAQLERQRTLGAMSYSFAHELSQPLTAILMDTQAIKTSLATTPVRIRDITESVADVERSAHRTVQLVDRIRSFIRPTQGAYETVDMKVLVQDVQHLLSYEIQKKNVQFDWDFDSDECIVQGDKIQLSQIVLNVYRNAIQAMMDDRAHKISVSLSCENQRVVMRVHDSGAGLSESVRDRVGQPFLTTKSDGLGIGFSISKTIAEMHSGNLNITNAVGGGALVELNLPAIKP